MILDVFNHGALAVFIDQATGRILGTQDRISGEAASLHFSPSYILAAETAAILAHESQFSEA